jgi:acyl-CoA dehydrogenase
VVVDLSLSPTEQELAASARAFIESEVVDVVRQMDASDTGVRPGWLATMARAGWLGMSIPAEFGGVGATALETAVVFEQFGRGPLPYLPIVTAAAAALIVQAGSPDWKSELLPGTADGSVVCASVGIDQLFGGGGGRSHQLIVEDTGATRTLTGVAPAVPFAAAATHLLVLVTGAESPAPARLVLVPRGAPGVEIRLLRGFLAWNHEVRFTGVSVPAADVVEVTDTAELVKALRPSMLWTAAYSVGGCSRALEMSRNHCNERIQFNQPIGRFQRVQDHVIRVLNSTDQARWVLYDALWRLDSCRPAEATVHLAKAVSADSYIEATNAAHEVFAGIGSDPMFGFVAYTRMSRTLFHYLGSPRWHKRHMINAVIAEHRR